MPEVYDARRPRENADVFRRVLVPVLLVAVTALAFGIASRWSAPTDQRPSGVRLTLGAPEPAVAAAEGAPALAAPTAAPGEILPLPAPVPPAPPPEEQAEAPAPTLTVVQTVVVVVAAPETATPSPTPSPTTPTPSPSATPTPTPSPAPTTTPGSPAPLAPDAWPLGPDGIGPLTLGLAAADAVHAGYLVADPQATGGYRASPALAGVVSVQVAAGVVRTITVTAPGPRTAEGAGVGTPLTELSALYGTALVPLPLPDAAGAPGTVPGLDLPASTMLFVPAGDAVGRVIIASKPDASASPSPSTPAPSAGATSASALPTDADGATATAAPESH